jgi:hypothetical protein
MHAITFRPAVDGDDVPALVSLYDGAARWMQASGIDQWRPGERDEEHFRLRMKDGEVWPAEAAGRIVGGFELWWRDEPAWGPRPPEAGYVHRLMVDRTLAPAGTGRASPLRASTVAAIWSKASLTRSAPGTNPISSPSV